MIVATVYGRTKPSPSHSRNEDGYIARTVWDGSHWLFAVIDGLGGYSGGHIATRIVRRTLLDYVRSHHGEDGISILAQAVTEANNALYNQRAHSNANNQMGCVITAVLLDTASLRLSVAHVGDTRLYQFSRAGLVKLTHDHSFVGTLLDTGRLTEAQAMAHPCRHLVDRTLGEVKKQAGAQDFIETLTFPANFDSTYLLCSDGLTDVIDSDRISKVLDTHEITHRKVKRLVDMATDAGSMDDITVVVFQLSIRQRSLMSNVEQSYPIRRKRRNQLKPGKSPKVRLVTLHSRLSLPWVAIVSLSVLLIGLAVLIHFLL